MVEKKKGEIRMKRGEFEQNDSVVFVSLYTVSSNNYYHDYIYLNRWSPI